MARQLTNVSGEVRTLQDSTGRWHVIEPEAIYSVDDKDERYYQTGECGEDAIWAEASSGSKAGSKSRKDEGDN